MEKSKRTYYLTVRQCSSKKKHIIMKSDDVIALLDKAKEYYHTKYVIEIYTGNWEYFLHIA